MTENAVQVDTFQKGKGWLSSKNYLSRVYCLLVFGGFILTVLRFERFFVQQKREF